jgi:hypothetical protein
MTELEQHHVRVFLRLRPLDRLEVNRRSRSVVEVLDDKRVAVEDPAEGDWEVACDGVSPVFCLNESHKYNVVA